MGQRGKISHNDVEKPWSKQSASKTSGTYRVTSYPEEISSKIFHPPGLGYLW